MTWIVGVGGGGGCGTAVVKNAAGRVVGVAGRVAGDQTAEQVLAWPVSTDCEGRHYHEGCECGECIRNETLVLLRGRYVSQERLEALSRNRQGRPEGWRNLSFVSREFIPPTKLPTNCKACNVHNPYIGPEHLTNGEYICRDCKGR